MAHMTNKKRLEREKNNRMRGFNPMNTGTRDMGYKSNNERKVAHKKQELKEYYN
ncbi:MAG: hypothetical protein MJ244_01520 [Clostridia bacterium]|nr:hypothetical protein [Clostridia bacterium]